MTDATHAYVAIAPCGCTVFATVDRPERARENAREIARCIADGLRVERVTNDWVRTESRWGCDVCEPGDQEALPL